MESTVSIDQFQEELQSWKHELSSFKKEIRHFEQHLESLSAKNLPKDLHAHIEHFQNSFICQNEVLDKLRHDLPDSRHKVEHVFKNLYPMIESEGIHMQDMLRDRMDMFRRIYNGVKEDFNRFESEWI